VGARQGFGASWMRLSGGVAAAALVGAVAVLLAFFTKSLSAWMGVAPSILGAPESRRVAEALEILREGGLLWGLFVLGVVLVGLPGWWFLIRIGRARLPYALLVGLMAGLGAAILFERLWGLSGGPNLTASDTTGLMIEGGHITPHGWATILRRAGLAGVVGALMALGFWATAYGLRLRIPQSSQRGV
jgi:hypothetical protein